MIYVASSWRNKHQPAVVAALQRIGLEVYDFRHPAPGDEGFAWSQISPQWMTWSPLEWFNALKHSLAVDGFNKDMGALKACSKCLLVLPCGRSAHLELGWAAGAGKPTAILALEHVEPDLMVAMCEGLFVNLDDAVRWCYK